MMPADEFDGPQRFEATQWSEIFRAQASQTAIRRQALGELAHRYYPALYAHLVRGRRYDHHRAVDFLQGFFADKLLEHRLVDHADPARGKFRSLLIRALHNYIIDVERPKKPVTTDPNATPEPSSTDVDPFDAAWARDLLDKTLARMKSECIARGQSSIWEVFECRLLLPIRAGTSPASYDELVHRFHFKSPEQASNALVTAKRTFHRVFAAVASEYLGAGDSTDDVLQDLLTTLHMVGPLEWNHSATLLRSIEPGDSAIHDVLDESTPELVAAMIERDPAASNWGTEDLAELMRHQLSQPCTSVLQLRLTELVRGEPPAAGVFSLLDLFMHPRPRTSALEAAKRYGRRQARNDKDVLLREVATVTYFAGVASALVHCGERISSSDDAVLRYGLQRIREHRWLPPELGSLFDKAIEMVSDD